jgi:N-acetylglucosamine malate deacetylase 1
MTRSSRRNFLVLASGGAVALSTANTFLKAGQLPGQPKSETLSGQEREFSRVMAIAAHPGDAFFAMGAPVAVAAHLGGQGSLLSLSLGERGSASIPAEQYGALQREAAQKAAALIGAKALFLPYPDGEIPANEEAKFAVCDLIRQFKPSAIVTHWKGSWHKDHRACYDIVDDAIFYAGLPAIHRKEPAHQVSKLFFADNWEDATGFVADTYLEITPVFDSWLNACSAFPMWRGENGFRYNDYYGSLAVARGCLSNFKRAVALMSPQEQTIRHIRTP